MTSPFQFAGHVGDRFQKFTRPDHRPNNIDVVMKSAILFCVGYFRTDCLKGAAHTRPRFQGLQKI
jgi:hypothetical protein